MQNLKLADDLFGSLRYGKKSVTIRKGRRDVVLGPLTFQGVTDIALTEDVEVISVTYTTLQWIAQEMIEKDGFRDRYDALEQMRRFYPDITLRTEVTVVEFGCP